MRRIKRSRGATRKSTALLTLGLVTVVTPVTPVAAVTPEELCAPGQATCCPLIHEEDDRAFFYCADDDASQEEAIGACESAGGRLARVTSSTINAAVTQDRGIWVDGNDIEMEGVWIYDDGSPIAFFNWGVDEPNGEEGRDCIHVLPAGTFHDFQCSNLLPYVCEADIEVVAQDCGNGVIEGTEECDDGNMSNNDECTNVCELAVCGDNYVQLDEACDDGNADETDGCTSTCEVTPCGNGVIDGDEECDDGNASNFDVCTNACTLAQCGDGFQQPGEECDNGGRSDDESCTAECLLPLGATLGPGAAPGCSVASSNTPTPLLLICVGIFAATVSSRRRRRRQRASQRCDAE